MFLAGDAVHLMIPTGGLGMNSGVGDAVDLAWKLAGTLRGWGGPRLLDSYEIERRQVGERNVAASRYASLGRRKWRSLWRDLDELVAVAEVEQRKSNEMIGAELGYRYAGSPLIAEEPGGPEDDFRATCRRAGRARACRTSGWRAMRDRRTASGRATRCFASARPKETLRP